MINYQLLTKKLTSFATLGLIALSLIVVQACKPTPTPEPEKPVNTGANGIYILNEGLFQMNNSTLAYYDFIENKYSDNIFLEQNSRGLGDIGNDLKSYGSKLYIVVNNSNRLEIARLSDAKSIKTIELPGKQPRNITFHRDKAYLTCYDGDVVRIDTNSLEVDGSVHSGLNPEGLCVCQNKLYVANSGGLNSPNYGNTISVIDLNSFTKIKEITVHPNPYIINCYNDRYLYISSRGNYGSIPYNFQKIDSQTDEIVKTFDLPVLNFTIYEDLAYLYSYNFSTSQSWIKVMDLRNDQIIKENFITDGTSIETIYGIAVNPTNGDVYITDAHNFTVSGDVYCFDNEGKKKFQFTTGLNPSSIVFKITNEDILIINNKLCNKQ